MPKVYNKYHQDAPDGAVYIGRPTKWGNPFVMGRGLSREFVIEKYREWLFERPELIEEAKRELAGKDLICYCAPKACHGDVLIEVANVEVRGPTAALSPEAPSRLTGSTAEGED